MEEWPLSPCVRQHKESPPPSPPWLPPRYRVPTGGGTWAGHTHWPGESESNQNTGSLANINSDKWPHLALEPLSLKVMQVSRRHWLHKSEKSLPIDTYMPFFYRCFHLCVFVCFCFVCVPFNHKYLIESSARAQGHLGPLDLRRN